MIRRILLVLASVFLFLAVTSAQDEATVFGDFSNGISFGAGNFTPSTGSGGLIVHGGWYHQVAPRILASLELSYTEFKSQIFTIDDVKFSTVTFLTAFKYVIPAGIVQPHLGLYLDVGFHTINESDLTPQGIVLESSLVRSYGIGGLAGITVSAGEHFLLFADARFGGDWLKTELQGIMNETRNLGGLSVVGGAIIVF